jgi:hypothetical protein
MRSLRVSERCRVTATKTGRAAKLGKPVLLTMRKARATHEGMATHLALSAGINVQVLAQATVDSS